MPVLTDPIMLDSTGQRIASALTQMGHIPSERVASLVSGNYLTGSRIVDAVGDPHYITETDLSDYTDYGLTETGWYVFARVTAEFGVSVGADFELTGAHYITPTVGDTHVDVAVKFGVAAESQRVTINWGELTEFFIFKATDLAVRNLDYRVTFYQYDLAPYCTWTWAVSSGTFSADKSYYTRSGEAGAYVYTKANVTTGQSIPANTYYNHTALTISGFVKNISYVLDEVDCPVTIVLPATDTENYGAWFEFQTNFKAVYSITITPATGDLVAGNHTQSPKKGVDIINLMYHRPTKTWLPTLTNWSNGV